MLTDDARAWLEACVRSDAKSPLLGALQVSAHGLRLSNADFQAAAAAVRQAIAVLNAPGIEVERALDTFTALALAAEHLADDDYHDERIGR